MDGIERRYQVFISSTYVDLVDERRELIQALLELDCIPAGMEMFPAADEEQWNLITNVIDDCDYYVVVVGGRYGSTDADGISYTEREYDYAVDNGIPVLGFVHANPSEIPSGKTEMDKAAQEKLEAFRTKVQRKPVKTFNSPDQLGAVVSRSLTKAMKAQPREGWVRGRHALTPEVEATISDLRAQNAELKLADSKRDFVESLDVDGLASGRDPVFIAATVDGGSSSWTWSWKEKLRLTWDDVFAAIGPGLMAEGTGSEMESRLVTHALLPKARARVATASQKGQLHADEGKVVKLTTHDVESRTRLKIAPGEMDRVQMHLRALRLIAPGTRKRGVVDSNDYWMLTERGEQRLVQLLAVAAPKKTVAAKPAAKKPAKKKPAGAKKG